MRRDHHLGRMCRSKIDAKPARNGTEGEHEDSLFNTLCVITSHMRDKYATLDHHVHNQSTGKWLKGKSKSQPFTMLSMSVKEEDYENFGFKLNVTQSQTLTYAMACQSSLAGSKVFQRLGLTSKDLMPSIWQT